MPNLKYVVDAKESKEINDKPGPGVIISASGMCNAGRIKHHLRHNLWRPGAQIVFTGYQGVGTPAASWWTGPSRSTFSAISSR